MEWVPDPVTGGKWFEVKETFRYKDGTTRQVATMKKFTMDVVKQFTYNAATGKFGPPKAIIGEELPSSILYHDGLAVRDRPRHRSRRWKQIAARRQAPGTSARSSPRASAASTTIRFPA